MWSIIGVSILFLMFVFVYVMPFVLSLFIELYRVGEWCVFFSKLALFTVTFACITFFMMGIITNSSSVFWAPLIIIFYGAPIMISESSEQGFIPALLEIVKNRKVND